MISTLPCTAIMRRASLYLFIAILALAGSACSSSSDDGPVSRRDNPDNPGNNSSNSSAYSASSVSSANSSAEAPTNGESSAPVNVNIEIENDTLSAAGATAIHLDFVDEEGEPVAATGTWTADSPCLADQRAGISAPVTHGSRVSFNYTTNGCVGEDTIIFSTQGADEQMLSFDATLTVEEDEVAFVSWQSTEPAHISIQGTGGNEKATVTFRLNGQATAAVAHQLVNFRLEGAAGGVELAETTATSDEDGLVRAVVISGTAPNVVTVVATHVASGIEAQSGGLVVATGLPSANNFHIALTVSAVDAWNRINEPSTEVIAAVTDRVGNPVVDGTVVNFVSPDGGAITSSCTTVNNTCKVTWKPDGRNPADGRARILATAKGTEHFIDNNGNNIFDDGDTFEGFDLGEPYIDGNRNGEHDLGEYFVDTNNNGVRDEGDGLWNGPNCQHSSLCSDQQYIDIAAHATVYVSNGSRPTPCAFGNFGPYDSNIVLTAGTHVLRGLSLSDDNHNAINTSGPCPMGNPLPAGTTVTFSVSEGTLQGKTSWTVPDDAVLPTGPYGIRYVNDDPGEALLILNVAVPGREEVEFYWDITIEEEEEEEEEDEE